MQGSNLCFLLGRQILYHWVTWGAGIILCVCISVFWRKRTSRVCVCVCVKFSPTMKAIKSKMCKVSRQTGDPERSWCYSWSLKAVFWQNSFFCRGGQSFVLPRPSADWILTHWACHIAGAQLRIALTSRSLDFWFPSLPCWLSCEKLNTITNLFVLSVFTLTKGPGMQQVLCELMSECSCRHYFESLLY